MEVGFTKMSPKGQVVIPTAIRKGMGITSKDSFLVFGKDNEVIFERISNRKNARSFEEIVGPLREAVKESGFTRKDLERVIREVRYGKKGSA